MTFFDRFLLWPLLLIGHVLATSLLAWHLLAQVNFVYPLGYKLLSIDQHIQQYAPLNRYKPEFEQTTPAEHQQLFSEIVDAVQEHGRGLAEISYRGADGSPILLMREAEVIHLQDVASLIDIFYRAGFIGLAIWLLLFGYAWQRSKTFPPLKRILAGFAALIVVASITIVIIGPTAVFYWLHIKIFPDEHEWFFFYQDSLMTTLMHAPQLFGVISVILVALFALIWAASVWGMARALPQTRPPKVTVHVSLKPPARNPKPPARKKNRKK